MLTKEDINSYTILLKAFKNGMGEKICEKIKVIMSDKDSSERGAISTVFPKVKLQICRFYSMQIFQWYINFQGLLKIVKTECFKFFLEFIYCLRTLYRQFCRSVPVCVVQYFNKNWHEIRHQWTVFGMNNENYGNLTNNRLESLNQKLRNVMEKNNTLLQFLEKFFKWQSSHTFENYYKLSRCYTTKSVQLAVENPSNPSSQMQYFDF